MDKKYYEMLVLFDDISKSIDDFLNFLKVAIERYYPNEAEEITVFLSSEQHTIYLLLKFNFKKFLPSYFLWFNNFGTKLNLKIIDFMKIDRDKREEMLKDIEARSQKRFTMPFDIKPTQKIIRREWLGFDDRRESERFRAEIRVKFKTPKDFLKKYTEDISKGGIFIKAINPLPINTKVRVLLDITDPDGIELTGRVVYVLSEDEAKKTGRNPGMGVEFSQIDSEIGKKLEGIIERIRNKITLNFEEKRRDERVQAEVKLRFKTDNGFIQRYTEDISKGGVFIKTDKPLPFDTRVKVLFELPDSRQIELIGKVVYVLNEKDARSMMRSPGMGIQFIDVQPEVKKKIEEFIEEIKAKKLNGEKKR